MGDYIPDLTKFEIGTTATEIQMYTLVCVEVCDVW